MGASGLRGEWPTEHPGDLAADGEGSRARRQIPPSAHLYLFPSLTIDEIYLSEALKEARAGVKSREEPVGAVAVLGGRVVGRAHQQTASLRDPTAHAVMIVLTQAAEEAREPGRPKDLQLFVTEMPCRMCLAAAQLAGVRRIVYGTARKVVRPAPIPVTGLVLEKECKALRSQNT